MTTETAKTLKFDTSNLAKKGNPIIPFLGSFSYASLETVNDDWKPQGAYYQDEKLPDVHFNWDNRHLVVNVGPDATILHPMAFVFLARCFKMTM